MDAAEHAVGGSRAPWVEGIPFDRLPPGMTLRAFGVDYAHIRTAEGGDLYVTREGWPFLRPLLPENWYTDGWYVQAGERLPGSTGNVYRVPTRPAGGRSIEIVVKFSRVGQEVPLEVHTTFPDTVRSDEIAGARFNSPMEEFGLVMEMRRGAFGPRGVRILSHRPLAIFTPAERFELWQLGRSHSRFSAHKRLLEEDREESTGAIELDIRREYVLVYSWLKGENAEEACNAGRLPERELAALTRMVIEDLRAKGFRVLDNKPKHFILRPRDGGVVRRRDGRIVYGLVDFELLQRSVEYQNQFKYAQRVRYWQLQNPLPGEKPADTRSDVARMRIFGVNYVFGTAPNGGLVWAVGEDPNLLDYFLPDRWRRTPRMRLALSHEVYRTRTRDNIHVVYRRSRVGERPSADPFYEQGKRIREHGYNSPFEEIAIAERLRRVGIPCVYPRAIYRTGHESIKAAHLRDERRFASHAHLSTPEPVVQPILSPNYDYYVILGYFRGMDPHKYYRRTAHWGFIDAEKAYDDGVITLEERRHVVELTRRRLARLGFASEAIDDVDFLLPFDENQVLRRDEKGEFEVIWCTDARTAFEHGLLSEQGYGEVLAGFEARLRAIGCEALNLSGNHLLVAMNPDGVLRRDDRGAVEVTLCNFELLRTADWPLDDRLGPGAA
ncbi:MAG: hypothetical protein HRF43_16860 [Phycisphaerae bacterium]|jgi:hypothetical protein